LVLEDNTQQLLETKYTLILGELFKIALDLRQYVMTNLAPRRRIVIVLGPNLVITLVIIDNQGYVYAEPYRKIQPIDCLCIVIV
jgi:hypothetical protein